MQNRINKAVHRSANTAADRHPAPKRISDRHGATLVEFALVAPIFFLLLFAGIEFAALSTIRSTAHNAAYEAARKVVVPGAQASEAADEARRILAIVGVRTADVSVEPSVISGDTEEVTVAIGIPYAENALFTPMFTGQLIIRSSITMQTERFGGKTKSR